VKAHPWLVNWLLEDAKRVANSRPFDLGVGGTPGDHYMLRWWRIPRNDRANVYIHRFRHSDDDRALHDHPYPSCSMVLEGSYVEHTIAQGGIHHRRVARAGDITFRGARAAHRIELTEGECWSLFLTGPRVRDWGFHCPKGWVHHDDFADPNNPGLVGPGCGEK